MTDYNDATKVPNILGNGAPDTAVALSGVPTISSSTCRGNCTGGIFLKNQKGFTLLELLVAITLMAIGILSVLGMQTVALRSNTHAYQLSVATSLGQQVLEDVLSWPINESRIRPGVGDGPFPYPDLASPVPNPITIQGAGVFTVACTRTFKTPAGNGVPENAVMIVVTITYANNNTVTLTGFKGLA